MNKIWGDDTNIKSQDITQIIPFDGPDMINLDVDGNDILFYRKIDYKTIANLNKTIIRITKKLYSEYGNDAPPIKLHINSPGGTIFDAFAALDIITSNLLPIHTIIEGICASAATFLSIAGKKRSITKNSYMMIHQISTFAWGKYETFKDEMQNLDELMTRIKLIYSKFTKVPESTLDEILKHDIYWDAQKCLEYGLVDEII